MLWAVIPTPMVCMLNLPELIQLEQTSTPIVAGALHRKYCCNTTTTFCLRLAGLKLRTYSILQTMLSSSCIPSEAAQELCQISSLDFLTFLEPVASVKPPPSLFHGVHLTLDALHPHPWQAYNSRRTLPQMSRLLSEQSFSN